MDPRGRPRHDAIGQDHATMLERLARGERAECAATESLSSFQAEGPDPRSVCLLRLGALVASVSSQAAFQRLVADSIIAGLGSDEIIEAMVALTSVVGRARVAAAAPKLALALGYDLEPSIATRAR